MSIGYMISLWVIVICVVFILWGFLLMMKDNKRTGEISGTHKPYDRVQNFAAPVTGTFGFNYVISTDSTIPMTITLPTLTVGRVYYDNHNDRIICGDDLVELGDL